MSWKPHDIGLRLAHLYAETRKALLKKAKVRQMKFTAIGCHGQTFGTGQSLDLPYKLATALTGRATKLLLSGFS